MSNSLGGPDVELVVLAEWCRSIVRFLSAHSPPENQPMYAQFEEAIVQGVEGGSTKGMKELARILAEWTKMLPADLNEQLDDLLRSKRDGSQGSTVATQARQVQRILEQGFIQSDEQYRLLLSRVDEIFQDKSKRDELERINVLLASHDQPRGRK